jgi:hypothetical protein
MSKASGSYKEISKVLNGHYEKSWAKLPVKQRQAWRSITGVTPTEQMAKDYRRADGVTPVEIDQWDSLDAEQREESAMRYDMLHDPANTETHRAWWGYYMAIDDKEREIQKWELMNDGGVPSEAKMKESELARLRAELKTLQTALPGAPETVTSQDGEQNCVAGNATFSVSATGKRLPPGVSTAELSKGFGLNSAWADALSHIDSNPFLKPALIKRGDVRSKRELRSHLWNPATFGNIIATREKKGGMKLTNRQVLTIIRNHFPLWIGEWLDNEKPSALNEAKANEDWFDD